MLGLYLDAWWSDELIRNLKTIRIDKTWRQAERTSQFSDKHNKWRSFSENDNECYYEHIAGAKRDSPAEKDSAFLLGGNWESERQQLAKRRNDFGL